MQDDNRSALHRAATDYIASGWAVVPLHDVREGVCTCYRLRECPTPGKHPRTGPRWNQPEHLLITPAQVDQWYGGGHPFNVGIATGAVSGFWALDEDPLKGGDVSLRELEEIFGELPLTRRHRTGSGGHHYLFRLPTDFEIGLSRGSLPRGLDVRGTGGQIVAPPSVTDRGGYEVDRPGPILHAPEWLLALIRPEVAPERPTLGRAPLPGELRAEGAGGEARLTAWALRAVEGELRVLASAPAGERGSTAVRVAYRLNELVNAPWAGLAAEGVWAAYVHAAETAMRQGGGFDLTEATESWKSASRKVGTREAVLPPDVLAVSAINPGLPPSSYDVAPPVLVGAGSVSMAEAPAVDHPVPPVPPGDAAVDALISRMLTPREMRSRPKPRPLVAGLLDLDTTAWMIAEPGGFKSFVALDIAARVASGAPWQGRRTHHGKVVYVVAEGAGGMSLRVDAWERTYGDMDGVLFLPEPVQAGDPAAWGVLVEALRRIGPCFVVFDTQARVTVGMEENSAKEMGVFIEAVEQARRATGACVLVVHHLGRNGNAARGSSAIDGAQSTELRVVRKGKALACSIHQDKQKDADDSEVIELTLRKIDMGVHPETGRELSSLVIDPVRVVGVGEADETALLKAATLTAAGKLTKTLMDHFSEGLGGTKAEIMKVFRDLWPMDDATRYRAWNECLKLDVMRSFEGRSANFRYNPIDNRADAGQHRDPFDAP